MYIYVYFIIVISFSRPWRDEERPHPAVHMHASMIDSASRPGRANAHSRRRQPVERRVHPLSALPPVAVLEAGVARRGRQGGARLLSPGRSVELRLGQLPHRVLLRR